MSFDKHLDELISSTQIELSATQKQSLLAFANLVAEWSKKTDLVSSTSQQGIAEILFCDAFALHKSFSLNEVKTIVDIGAGAGAPTLPLLLLRDGLHGTLVEPRRKRVTFLRFAISRLGIAKRCTVVESTMDVRDPQVSGMPFDLALSRATFAPDQWMALGPRLAFRTAVLSSSPMTTPENSVAETLHYALPGTQSPRILTIFHPTNLSR